MKTGTPEPNCTIPPEQRQYFACAEVWLVPPEALPRLAVSLSGTGSKRVATVTVDADSVPWRGFDLRVTETLPRPRGVRTSPVPTLFDGILYAEADGRLHVSQQVTIGASKGSLCVIVAPDWVTAPSGVKCGTDPASVPQAVNSHISWLTLTIAKSP